MPGFAGFADARERWRLAEPPLAGSAELRASGFLSAPALAGLAWWLWTGGHPLWAALCALAAPAFLYVALRGREGACPRCRAPIRVVGAGPARCAACPGYGYFRAEGGRLTPLPPGSTDAAGGFRLTRADLAGGALRLPWDGGCCVCGARAERRREVRFADQVSGLPGVAGRVETLSFGVPVCAAHADGARTAVGGAVALRSYDYWLEFLRLNGRPA